jgi:hypothetical protein
MSVNILITYRWIKLKGEDFFAKFSLFTNNKNGQSLIEFLLLFAVLIGITSLFYTGAMSNIMALWEQLLNLVIDDNTQSIKLGQ